MENPSMTNHDLLKEIALLRQRIAEMELCISEHGLIDASLRESEKRFRAIADYTPDWECWVGTDGKLIWVNPSVYNLTGYSVDECMQMDDYPMPMIHEADRERITSVFLSCLQGSTGNDIEFKIVCKDRSVKWAAVSWQPIFDDNGTSLGHRASIRDITRRKQTENQLHLLSAIAANMSDSIVMTDALFAITYINKKAEEMFGYSIDEIRGHTPEIFNADPAADEIQRELYAIVSQGKDYLGESLNKRKDGSTFFCEYKVTPLIGKDGAPYAYVGLQKDITERKRMEIQLIRARHELEIKVKERTRELEEANTALRVYLQQQSGDQKKVEEKLQLNVNELVLPYIEKLKLHDMGAQCRTYVELLELNLQNIVSPFMKNLTAVYQKLTSQEIQIAEFIRQGKSSQEIAGVLNLSVKTVNTHRNNIRKKLKLRNKEMNLRSYLLSLS